MKKTQLIVALYRKKENKKKSSNFFEMDLKDLMGYGNKFHIDELLKIPSTKTSNKTILQWFAVEDFSYWWIFYTSINQKFNEAATFVDQLISFIEESKPDVIKLQGIYDKLDLVKKICKLKKITLKVSFSGYLSFSIIRLTKTLAKKFLLRTLVWNRKRKRVNLFKNKELFDKLPSNYVLVIAHESYRRNMIDETGELRRQEFIIQPILDKLKKNKIPMLCLDIDYTAKKGNKILKERLSTDFNWVPIEILLTKSPSLFVKKSLDILNKSIKNLIRIDFENIFNYRKISLGKYVEQSFNSLMDPSRVPSYVTMADSLEQFFKQKRPRAIVMVYAAGPFQKACLIAAKKLSIKTIEFQHGVIGRHHSDYLYKEIRNSQNLLGNPIPDLTLVFGDFYKKILTDSGHFPSEKVAVIGNPTFYSAHIIKNSFNRINLLQKYNIPDKKIILVPLDYRFSTSESNSGRIILQILNEGMKDDDNSIVLVRPHPGDPFDQSLLDKLFNNKNFRCSTGTLLEDIFISDLLVTEYSTMAIDATIFEKPVIFANDLADSYVADIQNFMIEHSVAISCKKEELISKIHSIKKGELWKTEQLEERKKFMKAFFNYGETVDLLKLLDDPVIQSDLNLKNDETYP